MHSSCIANICPVRMLAANSGIRSGHCDGAGRYSFAQWTFIGQTVVDAPSTVGCDTGLDYKTSIRIAGAWEALLVYDCIIFGLTIYKTWTARLDHVITGISIPLITLLLRDGAVLPELFRASNLCLKIRVLVLCNLLNILTFYFTGPFWRGNLATFASCMSLTMICRLMLNLHRTADSGINTTHRTLTELDIACPTTGTLDIETSWRDSRVDIF
ncbi:hypothetical protein D9619_010639 [Psilocybe cf. subviscida]|uniref:Uncharacterized protein n=1 Tax=Psilocybe cf. subviscida TaxID=2480587 RepID=A0A8H5BAT5_9AGAR|nr:hypothetical protein D9619_010639 [Psilocybe cf. subviscida]